MAGLLLRGRGDGSQEVATDENDGERHCSSLSSGNNAMVIILMLISLVILIIHSFTKRRKNLCHDCCNGRPGLIIPVDLLHSGRNRLIYAVIFGAMSNVFMSFVFSPTNTCGSGVTSGICKAMFTIVVVLVVCVLYGPVFAGVDAPVPLLGHITGLLHLITLIVYEYMTAGYQYKGCGGAVFDRTSIVLYVLSDIPSYVFFLILLGWFIYHTVVDIVELSLPNITIRSTQTFEGSQYAVKYVMNLFQKRTQVQLEGQRQHSLSFIWAYKKGFRFPLKFLAPLMVMISVLFKLTFMVTAIFVLFVQFLIDLWKSYGQNILTLISRNGTRSYDDVEDALNGVLSIGPICLILNFVLCSFLLLQMAASVHKHLDQAAQGKFNFYSGKPPSHARILVSSLKYCGYQIGYFIWAWIIYAAVLGVIGFAAIFIILLLKFFPSFAGSIVTLIFSPLWLLIVAITETLICKFAFLNKNKGGKILWITNWNAFSWISYFFFLYNAIVGIFGSILRIILSLVFGTLLLFRLDRNIMMTGFQFADLGHKTYKGFLYLEHTCNNPIVKVFVNLLLKDYWCPKTASITLQGPQFCKKRRIRNRWLVAYTLVRNPSLCHLRAARKITEKQPLQKMAPDQLLAIK